MTFSHVLDTDTLSELQKGNPRVASKLESAGPARVATTVVSAYEQLQGRFNQIRKAQQSRKAGQLPEAYLRLREAVDFFQRVPVLDYTAQAEQCHDELRSGGLTPQKVHALDLQIGCIALSLSAVLVTRNRRDFQHIPGLLTEDWTV
jgi:tRNA(fMet)-specific endonuclease VapC